MHSRTIPSSGEPLPVIGLGTWQTFSVGSDRAARAPLAEVLELFVAGGAKLIDSSPMYGSSESVAGDLMAAGKLRDRLFVATKIWTSGRDDGIRQIEASFKKLRVERMDLMQVHNLLDVGVHTKTLLELQQKGRVRYIGITHYASSAHAQVVRLLKAQRYDFLQINYSLDEPEAEREVLPAAGERGVAVIVNRPFAEGSMFRRVRGKPLPPWAAELGIASWAQYFLKWIVSHPAVTCAIPATSKPAHLRDNLQAGHGALPDEATRRRMREYYETL
jgi:diketogulonate reductase-like aldo/keto reductase